MAAIEPARAIAPEPIGERMKRARRRAKLTVAFMAEHFDVSIDTVRSWEQSRHQPRAMLDRLEEWARLTNVPYAWLLTGDTVNSHLYAVSWATSGGLIHDDQLRLDLTLPPAAPQPSLSLV